MPAPVSVPEGLCRRVGTCLRNEMYLQTDRNSQYKDTRLHVILALSSPAWQSVQRNRGVPRQQLVSMYKEH